LLDYLLDLFKAADSILELFFKPRSCDVLGFDPREAVLLKLTIHSALSFIWGWFHEKIAGRRNFFGDFSGLTVTVPGARGWRIRPDGFVGMCAPLGDASRLCVHGKTEAPFQNGMNKTAGSSSLRMICGEFASAQYHLVRGSGLGPMSA
jgi:hypothetical protein